MMSLNGPFPCIPALSELVNNYKKDFEKISTKIKNAEAELRKLKDERNAFQREFQRSAQETMNLHGVRKFEGDKYVTELVTVEKPDICKTDFDREYKDILNRVRKELPDYVEVSLKPKLPVLKTMSGSKLPGWCHMISTTSISIRKIHRYVEYKGAERVGILRGGESNVGEKSEGENGGVENREVEFKAGDSEIMISEVPCTVSEIASRINAAGMLTEPADAIAMNRWLVHEGVIENDPVLGRSCKIPTELGKSIGIMLREGKRNDGKAYRIPIYSSTAQLFIIDNLDGFAEFLNRGRKQAIRNAEKSGITPQEDFDCAPLQQ